MDVLHPQDIGKPAPHIPYLLLSSHLRVFLSHIILPFIHSVVPCLCDSEQMGGRVHGCHPKEVLKWPSIIKASICSGPLSLCVCACVLKPGPAVSWRPAAPSLSPQRDIMLPFIFNLRPGVTVCVLAQAGFLGLVGSYTEPHSSPELPRHTEPPNPEHHLSPGSTGLVQSTFPPRTSLFPSRWQAERQTHPHLRSQRPLEAPSIMQPWPRWFEETTGI